MLDSQRIYYYPNGEKYYGPQTNHQQLQQIYIPIIRDKVGNITRYYLYPKTKGGINIFKKVFNAIYKFIMKAFNPIIKPIKAMVNVILLIVKAIMYISAFLIWVFRLHVWFFLVFLPSLPADILLLTKNLTYLIIDAVTGWIKIISRRAVNKFANVTLDAVAVGADNVKDNTGAGDNNTNPDTNNTNTNDDKPKCNDTDKNCYKATDGTVPFSVIIITILLPPAGVFIEYGLTGWFQILICSILTLLFYFPGLIYALVLLYC